MSYISPQVTFELGQYLWRDAIVHFSDPERFVAFFQDRPQICPHVRCISIDLQYFGEGRSNTDVVVLHEMADYISKNLDLRAFCIRLHTILPLSDIQRIGDLKMKSWGKAFDKLTVQERVSVHVPGHKFVSEIEKELFRKQFRKWWFPTNLGLNATDHE